MELAAFAADSDEVHELYEYDRELKAGLHPLKVIVLFCCLFDFVVVNLIGLPANIH